MKKWLESLMVHENPDNIGQVLLEWEFPEYTKHERSKWWYILAGVIVVGLLIFSIWTINFLFAVIVLFVAFILAFEQMREPRVLEAKISDLGIWAGGQFHEYADLESFWLIYNPPEVKKLFLSLKKSSNQTLVLSLESSNPLLVRQILEQFLNEDLDRVKEPFDEVLARKLKLF